MEDKETQSIAMLWAASTALTFFWILNVAKEASSQVKSFLNFYPPVGPLLGLFSFSILILLISYVLIKSLKPKNQKAAFLALLTSSVLYFFMVFPPVYEIIVDLFK